jgi:hypothetical protein
MKTSTLDTWTWVLVYGGLIALSLGWFIIDRDALLAHWVQGAGAVACAAGVLLWLLRSRRP